MLKIAQQLSTLCSIVRKKRGGGAGGEQANARDRSKQLSGEEGQRSRGKGRYPIRTDASERQERRKALQTRSGCNCPQGLKGTALTTPPKPSILPAERPGPAPARETALRAGSPGENSLPGRFFSSEGRKKALFTPFTRVDTAPGGLVSGEP